MIQFVFKSLKANDLAKLKKSKKKNYKIAIIANIMKTTTKQKQQDNLDELSSLFWLLT